MGIEFRQNKENSLQGQLQNDEIVAMADEIQDANETQDAATATAATTATGSGSSYSAADAADWNGTAPSTVKEALDRLAAAAGPVS